MYTGFTKYLSEHDTHEGCFSSDSPRVWENNYKHQTSRYICINNILFVAYNIYFNTNKLKVILYITLLLEK